MEPVGQLLQVAGWALAMAWMASCIAYLLAWVVAFPLALIRELLRMLFVRWPEDTVDPAVRVYRGERELSGGCGR